MLSRVLAFAFLGLVFSGCWNKEFNEPGELEVNRKPTEGLINSNFQRVWMATQTTLGKFPMIRKEADSNTGRGYVVTDWIRGKSDVLYHGFDRNRIPYVIRYKLFVYVNSESGRTKVTIKNIEQYLDDSVTAGVDFQGGVYTWIRTESSTLKENTLLEQIAKLVADPQFKVEN